MAVYPESVIISKKPEIVSQVVTAVIQCYLNPVDRGLVDSYGPLTVDIGGTFGVTISNPAGVVIPSTDKTVVDGTEIRYSFSGVTIGVADALAAAVEWQAFVVSGLDTAVLALRALDTSLTVPADIVTPI